MGRCQSHNRWWEDCVGGPDIHREMELLAGAGLDNVDVLKSVTSTNAEVFGIDDIGMIEEGKRSDMLLEKELIADGKVFALQYS